MLIYDRFFDRIIDNSKVLKATGLCDKDFLSIEEGLSLGAIITDITGAQNSRELVAQKAKEVINKNISIVQEIACLLGEHMVETETLLSAIANDYNETEE